MADNQITPFQLTDQFTMDNFNQRINETNIALQNKAPVGFGFGEKVVEIRTTSADETYETYCAKLDAVLEGMGNNVSKLIGFYPPAIYGRGVQIGLLHKWSSDYASVRTLGNYDGVANGFFGVSMRKVEGNWKPMEWINPPMVLGVEYRTTERYQGKPVYVKLVDCGTLPNATTKKVKYGDSVCRPIFGYGISSNDNTFPSFNYGHPLANSFNSPNIVSLWFNANEVSIACGGDRSAFNAYVFVKYWKTTD